MVFSVSYCCADAKKAGNFPVFAFHRTLGPVCSRSDKLPLPSPGLMRSLVPVLHPQIPIRINALAPSWTETGIVNRSIEAIGASVQGPEHVARAAVLLM